MLIYRCDFDRIMFGMFAQFRAFVPKRSEREQFKMAHRLAMTMRIRRPCEWRIFFNQTGRNDEVWIASRSLSRA
jgi:hypothetical protein